MTGIGMNLELQTIYILHKRAYRDTSLLLDCLTEHEGLVPLLAKGAKRPKSPLRVAMTAFVPITASWYGRGELKVLRQAERLDLTTNTLVGKQLYSGFYLNELLLKVLHRHAPCPAVFKLYQSVLTTSLAEADLRRFELGLLAELGYAVDLLYEAHSGAAIEKEGCYYYQPGVGLTAFAGQAEVLIFQGEDLLAIAANDFSKENVLRAAKRLTRLALMPLVGNYQFKSRELFV